MAAYRNSDVHNRVWPGIQRNDGRTLELDPGEECDDVALDDDFIDPWLQPVGRRTRRVVVEPEPEPEPEPTPQPQSDAEPPDVAPVTEQES